MSKEATFKFTGKDNVSEALKTINANIQKVSKTTKEAAKSINRVNIALAALKVVANGVAKVVSAAFKTVISLVRTGLSTIKNLITGAFKFIKSALSTLLSWTTKALGKIFDGVKNIFNKILNTAKDMTKKAIQVIKKGIETIIESVRDYADKQYNEIQLKVSLGDSYDQVMKDFKELLRYTTADKNDLLSVFATYAEIGKKPSEIMRYAKATVYLANATGRSLSQIQRLLLGQEAAGSDLERTMKRLGINISEQEQSVSNIEKIISQLDDEMQDLSKNSLNQAFANVKNDLITIKEQIGQIFAGPIKYVTEKLDSFLSKLAGSNKITGLADRIEEVFDKKIKPIVDMLFDFLEKFIMDPKGFFDALWADIKQIGKNFLENLATIFGSLGVIFSTLFNRLIELLGQVDWYSIGLTIGSALSAVIDIVKMINWGEFGKELKKAFTDATTGLLVGLKIIETEDIEDSLKNTLINAWNRAYPNFQLSKEEGSWFSNLVKIFQALWEESLKPFYEDNLKPILDDIVKWVTGPFATVMGEVFSWLGEVLSAAFNNALINSDVFRAVINVIPGLEYVVKSDAQKKIYDTVGEYLPAGMKAEDITQEFLMSKKDKNQTWAYYLLAKSNNELFKEIRAFRTGQLLEEKYVPTFKDLADRITNALHPVVDELEDPVEWLKKDYRDQATQAIKDALKGTTFGVVTGPVYGPAMGVGSGGGGIQDYFATSNEFKIRPFAKGGLVTKPTLALIGEEGPEFIIPAKGLPMLANADAERYNIGKNVNVSLGYTPHERTSGGGGVNTNTGWFLSKGGTWRLDTAFNKLLDELGILDPLYQVIDTLGQDVNNLNNWWRTTQKLPAARTTGGGGINNPKDMYLDENGVWRMKSAFQMFVEDSKIGKVLQLQAKLLLGISKGLQTIFSGDFWKKAWEIIKTPFTKDFWEGVGKKIAEGWNWFKDNWYNVLEGLGNIIDKGLTTALKVSFGGVGFLAQHGAFGTHVGNIFNNSFDEDGKFSILQMFSAIIQELIPYLEKGLELFGGLFDEAFEILGHTVQILGERLGKQLLPILEAFVPLMKIISDILIALAPVMEAVLQPAIMIITAILQALVPILDMLMPIFAGIGAVIQWVAESIAYVVGSVINWLASWLPIKGVGELKKPGSIKSNYNTIMDAYYTARNTPASTITADSTSTASQTASYSGASVIHIHNDFSGAYVVGTNGFRELALIIKNTMQDLDYAGQTI